MANTPYQDSGPPSMNREKLMILACIIVAAVIVYFGEFH